MMIQCVDCKRFHEETCDNIFLFVEKGFGGITYTIPICRGCFEKRGQKKRSWFQ